MRRYAKYVVSAGLIIPSMVNAVGLGNLVVQSTLNQPLNAYIDLSLDDGTLLDGVKVHLADLQAFQKAGMERPYSLSKLSFKVMRFQGKPIVQLSSFERMNTPFINVLLDVTWAKGQIYRSYTILLDPPGYQMVLAKDKNTTYQPAKNTYNRPNRARSTISLPKSGINTVATIYGPTKNTDDLWNIALKYKPQNATMNQVMLGIIRLNPKAFTRGNINALKQNVKLKIPTSALILATNPKQALMEVNSHMNAWKNKADIHHVIDLSVEPKLDIEPEKRTSSVAKIEEIDAINKSQTGVSLEAETTTIIDKDILEPIQTKSSAKTSIQLNDSDDVEVVESEKMLITSKPNIVKEKLFDDFITIPKVLKKIVKKPKLKAQINSIKNNVTASVAPDTAQDLTPEVAVAMSAIETVKESNQLLRQQVQSLVKQNEILNKQLVIESKQDRSMQRKIDILMKLVEKDYVVAEDGTLVRKDEAAGAANNGSFNLTSLLSSLLLLFILAAGGTYAFLYHKQQRKKEVDGVLDEELMTIYEDKVMKRESAEVETLLREEESPRQYSEAVISTKAVKDETESDLNKKTETSKLEPLEFITDLGATSQKTEEMTDPVTLKFGSTTIEKNKDKVVVKQEPEHQVKASENVPLELELVDVEGESEADLLKEAALKYDKQSNVNLSTQIALAETYIAMEDWQSAKESLEIVIKEGNEAQVNKALNLLKQIPS